MLSVWKPGVNFRERSSGRLTCDRNDWIQSLKDSSQGRPLSTKRRFIVNVRREGQWRDIHCERQEGSPRWGVEVGMERESSCNTGYR